MGTRGRRIMGAIAAGSAVLIWGLVVVGHAAQPDALAAVTVFPIWVWVVPGMGLAGGAAWALRSRRIAAIVLLWLATGVLISDKLPAVLRLRTGSTSACGW